MTGIFSYLDLRRIRHSGKRMILTLFFLTLFFLLLAKPAFAFDTGHHSDLTKEALQDQGFGETAIQTVQVQNWLVDYFSSSPTSSIEGDVAKLHFDNLFTTEQIRNYWVRLSVNTRSAVQQAAR